MNPNNNPSPKRWARLKKQLTQARAEADTAKRQRDWAYLFISSTNQWQEFNRWIQEQPNNDINTVQAEAEQATQRLTIAQKMGEICKVQAEGNYNMVGRLSARVDSFLATVDSLIARVIAQREEIAALKNNGNTTSALKIEDTTPDLNTAPD